MKLNNIFQRNWQQTQGPDRDKKTLRVLILAVHVINIINKQCDTIVKHGAPPVDTACPIIIVLMSTKTSDFVYTVSWAGWKKKYSS